MSYLSIVKFKVKQLLGKAPDVAVQIQKATQFYGSGYGGWAVVDGLLNQHSVVYSFGVGEDISFDLALIERYGCVIHAFDPTPRVAEWLAEQHLPPQFIFHQCALSDTDGSIRLFAPKNPAHISHSVNPVDGHVGDFVDVPSKRLATICGELGHTHIHLLKMDIEGFEYGVTSDLVATSIDQLLIEFHHTMYGIPVAKTEQAISELNQGGYSIFDISDRGQEFGFVTNRADLQLV